MSRQTRLRDSRCPSVRSSAYTAHAACGLDTCLGEDPVDLLVVDGPPADTSDKVLARYPALPALAPRLAAGATVVLDDIEHPGEQEVLRRWTQRLGLRFAAPDVHAGIAVARTAPTPLDKLSR